MTRRVEPATGGTCDLCPPDWPRGALPDLPPVPAPRKLTRHQIRQKLPAVVTVHEVELQITLACCLTHACVLAGEQAVVDALARRSTD